MDKWQCLLCGYIYDPEEGDPTQDIAPGTAFRRPARRLGVPGLRRQQGRLREYGRLSSGLAERTLGEQQVARRHGEARGPGLISRCRRPLRWARSPVPT